MTCVGGKLYWNFRVYDDKKRTSLYAVVCIMYDNMSERVTSSSYVGRKGVFGGPICSYLLRANDQGRWYFLSEYFSLSSLSNNFYARREMEKK